MPLRTSSSFISYVLNVGLKRQLNLVLNALNHNIVITSKRLDCIWVVFDDHRMLLLISLSLLLLQW